MGRVFCFIVFVIILLFAPCANSDQTETPYDEMLRILKSQWFYPLDEEETHNCALFRITNSILINTSNALLLPGCFMKDSYIALRFPPKHPAVAKKEIKKTPFFHTEATPLGLGDVSYGRILLTKVIPESTEINEYFLPYLTNMRDAHVTAFAINMNGNIGGDVEGAATFLRYFAEVNTTEQFLFEIRKRAGGPTRYVATERGMVAGACLAVMVNKETASSAEIIAYTLQQQMNAYVLGEITYKKGVAQITTTLHNGAKLQFTHGQIFFPDNTTTHGRGVIPNFITNDEHTQWEQAQNYLRRCYTKKNNLPK